MWSFLRVFNRLDIHSLPQKKTVTATAKHQLAFGAHENITWEAETLHRGHPLYHLMMDLFYHRKLSGVYGTCIYIYIYIELSYNRNIYIYIIYCTWFRYFHSWAYHEVKHPKTKTPQWKFVERNCWFVSCWYSQSSESPKIGEGT